MIEFATDTGVLSDDLRRQLELLVTTPVGTVVFDRDFGIDTACLDMPFPVAQNMLAAELAEKIPKYIPALALQEVKLLEATTTGELNLKVVVALADI